MTQIYHAHLYGTCNSRYDWLQGHAVLSTDWQALRGKQGSFRKYSF